MRNNILFFLSEVFVEAILNNSSICKVISRLIAPALSLHENIQSNSKQLSSLTLLDTL